MTTNVDLEGTFAASERDRSLLGWVPRPANDTVPCRLDVVLRAAEVRRLSIDGIERLLCGAGTQASSVLSRRRPGILAGRAPVG